MLSLENTQASWRGNGGGAVSDQEDQEEKGSLHVMICSDNQGIYDEGYKPCAYTVSF